MGECENKEGLHARGAAYMHDAFRKPHRSKLCVVVISFWAPYLSQKTIGGLPTARTRNSDGLDRPPPVSGVSDPAVSSIRTESIAQANMPTHLPALNQGRFGLPHALFNPLYLLCSKASCQRVHPFSGVIVEP
ncbi:hypothetical protein PSV08DRAFT_387524 [Bipolaris maydis]|uniref:uncharacterized protein n=1 Tax=Cochliobolus heterostrophus TaxID=5016 RepID=UPI0024D6687D|nr:hypothetical protein J3E73DRAFT_407762 [Bipolaris maydis]KAJ6272932.1 hypothetical protein PSV08DRAFT_387524 [Bipolaris maydis]